VGRRTVVGCCDIWLLKPPPHVNFKERQKERRKRGNGSDITRRKQKKPSLFTLLHSLYAGV
jgi:hypothetical protein